MVRALFKALEGMEAFSEALPEKLKGKGFMFGVAVGSLLSVITMLVYLSLIEAQNQQALSNILTESRAVQKDLIESVQLEITQNVMVKTRTKVNEYFENEVGWVEDRLECSTGLPGAGNSFPTPGLFTLQASDSTDRMVLCTPTSSSPCPGLTGALSAQNIWLNDKKIFEKKLFGSPVTMVNFVQESVQNSVEDAKNALAGLQLSTYFLEYKDAPAAFQWNQVAMAVLGPASPSPFSTATFTFAEDAFDPVDCDETGCPGGDFIIALHFERVKEKERVEGPSISLSRFNTATPSPYVETKLTFSAIPSKPIKIHIPLRVYGAWWNARNFYKSIAKNANALFGNHDFAVSGGPGNTQIQLDGKITPYNNGVMLGLCGTGCGCKTSLKMPAAGAPTSCENKPGSKGCNDDRTVTLSGVGNSIDFISYSTNTPTQVSVTGNEYSCENPGETVLDLSLATVCGIAEAELLTAASNGFDAPSCNLTPAECEQQNTLCESVSKSQFAGGVTALNNSLKSVSFSGAPFGKVNFSSISSEDNDDVAEWKAKRECEASCSMQFQTTCLKTGHPNHYTCTNPFSQNNCAISGTSVPTGTCSDMPDSSGTGSAFLKCSRPLKLEPVYLKLEDPVGRKSNGEPARYCFGLSLEEDSAKITQVVNDAEVNAKRARCTKCSLQTGINPSGYSTLSGGPCTATPENDAAYLADCAVPATNTPGQPNTNPEALCVENTWERTGFGNTGCQTQSTGGNHNHGIPPVTVTHANSDCVNSGSGQCGAACNDRTACCPLSSQALTNCFTPPSIGSGGTNLCTPNGLP